LHSHRMREFETREALCQAEKGVASPSNLFTTRQLLPPEEVLTVPIE
jgi:hypothetical protein